MGPSQSLQTTIVQGWTNRGAIVSGYRKRKIKNTVKNSQLPRGLSVTNLKSSGIEWVTEQNLEGVDFLQHEYPEPTVDVTPLEAIDAAAAHDTESVVIVRH